MPDEQSEKIIRLLEEIRDLTKSRNETIDALVDSAGKKADEAVRQQLRTQRLAQKRFYFLLVGVVILGFLFFFESKWWR